MNANELKMAVQAAVGFAPVSIIVSLGAVSVSLEADRVGGNKASWKAIHEVARAIQAAIPGASVKKPTRSIRGSALASFTRDSFYVVPR